MKKIYKNIILSLSGVVLGSVMQSCVSEEQFGSGDGQLSLITEIKGDIKVETRAGQNLTTNASLRENCVVYIESNKGVVRKFIGLDNVPTSPISLKQGHYIAEAWTGDSVSASFTSKFYRGKEEFEITSGTNSSLLLRCNIANVITSVNQDVLQLGMKNVKVTFSHSRGSLTFTEANIESDKGYFMMPNADKDLQYTVTGEKNDGSQISRTGVISNVQRAHEYIMNITSEAGENQDGGGLIKITIEDVPVEEETVNIYGRPAIVGDGFDIADQIVGDRAAATGTSKAFTDHTVLIRAHEAINKLQLVCGANFNNIFNGESSTDILSSDQISKPELNDMGIIWDGPIESYDAVTGKRTEMMTLTFQKRFFDSLEPKSTEYVMRVLVQDNQSPQTKSSTVSLRIATSADAIEHKAPVETVEAPDPVAEPMAILAHSATLYGAVTDESVTDYGIKYRKQGDSSWISVPANGTRASSRFSVNLTGLEAGTTYEYKSYEAGYDNCEVMTFTTEARYTMPNSSFENWTTYSASTMLGTRNVILPWTEGNKDVSFWGSGNEGAATASLVLTDKSTDMVNSGTYSAKLASNSAFGVIAAGNVFVGTYVRTDGTNGVLSLGRTYNSSHPTKLSVYANYRPASGVTVKSGNEDYVEDMKDGGTDQGQIYVALTTEPVEIRTNPSDRKLFSVDDPVVVGYGQVTWKENFGPDGSLQKVEIPIEYNSRANSLQPKYIIIVATASKFGDFFSGAKGSTMYLDDFELVYE